MLQKPCFVDTKYDKFMCLRIILRPTALLNVAMILLLMPSLSTVNPTSMSGRNTYHSPCGLTEYLYDVLLDMLHLNWFTEGIAYCQWSSL